MHDKLSLPIESIRHVEGRRAELLRKLGIETVGDVLLHLPSRYLDVSRVVRIGDQFEGDITCSGTITSVKTKRPRPKLRITEVALTDDTATVLGVWFNQPWVETVFKVGQRYAFAGAMSYDYGMRRMQAPFIHPLDSDEAEATGEVIPVYPTTDGLAQGWIRRIAAQALDMVAHEDDLLPADLRTRHNMRSYVQALRDVHTPSSVLDAQAARNRLAYQELFDLALLNDALKYAQSEQVQGFAHMIEHIDIDAQQGELGITFTEDQAEATRDVLRDMGSPHPMHRLLLGDVGTGKTLVATMALMAAAHSGSQAAMMAPTEVLAKQYAQKVGPILDMHDISWTLLTSSLSVAQRRERLERISSGEVAVAFGTHALIQPDVVFSHLTLAVIDEQHRFGVEQRRLLREKSSVMPDMLAMTATPIPRSLALTLYGDLDISSLRQRPIEGAGTATHMRSFKQVSEVHQTVREALDQGRQAFIVCALIEESTKLEVKAATELAAELAVQEYANYRVELMHGALKPAQKDEIMQWFRDGQIDVLVSTTVIEVGVDIHNATQMVIYNAERFGLAQLHQLRGRVGRGTISGVVWLVSDSKGPVARQRFEALCSTDDGFELADIDLALRGAGDVTGKRQHGMATFRVADLVRDLGIIELAKKDVTRIMAEDPTLESPQYATLRKRLDRLRGEYEKWVSAG